ncbi:hypothetical protein DL98DRAFT_597434 [Cadophora sp. DSE1049]|nr:hypothetical protein DL98DRAFT_597434 [Cadophora sp. DSE1049]
MVAEVRGYVGELIELFPPAVKAEEKGICKEEVEGLKNKELVLLQDSVGSDDPTLQACASKVLVARGFGHLVGDFENIDSELNIGDVNAAGRQNLGHTVERFSNSGKSDVTITNRDHVCLGPEARQPCCTEKPRQGQLIESRGRWSRDGLLLGRSPPNGVGLYAQGLHGSGTP